MFWHSSERKDKTKIYEMNYQANKLVHKPCNCNNSVYICISYIIINFIYVARRDKRAPMSAISKLS